MSIVKRGRPDSSELSPRGLEYAKLVPGDDPVASLQQNLENLAALLQDVDESHAANFSYAPGKWTINEIVSHLSDTERIFGYRALRIARGDTTPLPGFEQDQYVATCGAKDRTLRDLLIEFREVRRSVITLFESFTPEAWLRKGSVSDSMLTVRGIAFTTAGHAEHHKHILVDQYLKK